VDGGHIGALRALASAVDTAYGRHITINATGAVAAVLGEAGIPTDIMRGIAVISRAAGLVGHVREEQETPAGRAIWDAAEGAVRYTDEQS
jgi:citrate synthase